MEKYLGNKSTLLPIIERYIADKCPTAGSISDFFSGTTNVSRYFRARGWRVGMADASRFSYVLGRTYTCFQTELSYDGLRGFAADELHTRRLFSEFERSVARWGSLYMPSSEPKAVANDLASLAQVLARLQRVGEANTRHGPITDHFTQWGENSSFESTRGSRGQRNYFSLRNALVIDGILAQLRCWWNQGAIELDELFPLLASVLEEVVITANVNGTFHDFNRTKLWPNANQSFQLRLPIMHLSSVGGEIANADAIEAATAFGHYDVCYLDPPYNFRQYGAYYHLLNFIAAFPFIDNLEEYLEGLSHVRGQNPHDDFTSDFCKQKKFISSMTQLIQSASADHIVLSYYGGRNHWNHWSNGEFLTDEGLNKISEIFRDKSIFSSFEVVPALDIRKNYQSRAGEKKKNVNEYLFYGKKIKSSKNDRSCIKPTLSNKLFGMDKYFSHICWGSEKNIEKNFSVRA